MTAARPVKRRLRRHGLAPRPAPIRRALPERRPSFLEGNRIDIFEGGRAGLAAMLEAIRAARSFVHLETYILRSDKTGRRFVEALVERAAAGVQARLLYDAFGSLGLDERILEPLRAAGGEVVAFNPLRRLYPRWAPRRRDHRKILIADGSVAFTGGLNIGDEYDAEPAPGSGSGWRDTHVRVEGPAVAELGALFLESWFRADGPELPWRALLPEPEIAGRARCAVIADGPSYRRRRLRDLLIAELGAARRRVRLTSAYFAPGRAVLAALEEAAARGVEVELLLAGRSDHPMLLRAARATVPRLLERGVRVYEYAPAILHAKSAVFDGRTAVVGTSNLDRQSFEHSYEVNLWIEGGGVPAAFDALFERDRERSTGLDAGALAARPWLAGWLDRLAALLVRAFV